jgi:hypothetical protein
MKTDIIITDNFYSNVDGVRQFALDPDRLESLRELPKFE